MIKRWPGYVAIAFLLFCIFPWDYGIYFVSKIPVCLAAAYYCHELYRKQEKQTGSFWVFLVIAIIFNPIIPVHLFFSVIWIGVDIAAAILFYRHLKTLRPSSH